jgi:hypothetical protein
MKLRILLLPFLFFLTLNTWGQKRPVKGKPHGKTPCLIQAWLYTTIEAGDTTALSVEVYDSGTYYNEPISSVTWSPSSSLEYANAPTTFAFPKTTTTYTVTVTTPCGVLSDTLTVHVGCAVNSWVYLSSYYYCPVEPGTASVYSYNGIPPYTYVWSTGQTTSSVSGISPGFFSVTVTDNIGCSKTDTFTMSSYPAPSLSAIPSTIEKGDSSELYINSSSYYYYYSDSTTYTWTPASSIITQDLYYAYVRPTSTTTYTLTTTSPCGTSTDTVTVFVGCPNVVIGNFLTTPYFCPAEMGTATVYYNYTAGPYSYLWSNGATTSTITGLAPGSYSLTVTDGLGCTFPSDPGTITASKIKLQLTPNNYYPNYYTNTVEPGDTTYIGAALYDTVPFGYAEYFDTSYKYSWAPAISLLTPNAQSTYAFPTTTTTYTLTITTPCTTLTDTITVFTGCTMTVNVQPSFCPTDSGAAVAGVINGVPPYSYLWSNGATTSSTSAIRDSLYTVTVTDANGCSTWNSAYIYPIKMNIAAYAYPDSIAPGDTSTIGLFDNYYDTLTPYNSYSWAPSASLDNPTAYRTYAHPTTTTTYTITTTTPCGVIIDSITVYVGCNLFVQPICIVTMDTSINKNVIIWGRSSSPPNGSFNLYSGNKWWWTKIGSVADTSLSEFIDYSSNPTTQAYNYRLTTVDSCGESGMSPISSSIYLNVIISTGRDSLYWTPYVGFTTPTYYIYRGPALNNLTLLDSVSGTILSYVDLSPPPGSIYLVKAVNPAGSCIPTHKRTGHGSSMPTNASFSNGGIPHIRVIPPAENTLSISPNPASGNITITYDLAAVDNVSISIIDAIGRTVYTNTFSDQPIGETKQQINLEGAAEGVYSLMMVTEEGVLVKKVVLLKSK